MKTNFQLTARVEFNNLIRGWANTSEGQITWPWAKITLTPRKILIFWTKNLIYWIQNLIFWTDILIFWTENLIYWTDSLLIWTDNFHYWKVNLIELKKHLILQTATWFFWQTFDCMHKKLILGLIKLIFLSKNVLIIEQELDKSDRKLDQLVRKH